MEVSIRNIGNSKGMLIPKRLLDDLQVNAGDTFDMISKNGKYILTPIKKKRAKYNLDDLIAKCDENAPMPNELEVWDDFQPIGKEIL